MLLLTALLGAVLVALAPAPAANAHDATPTPSCTGLAVDARSYSGSAQNRITVVIDGETVHDGTFGAGFAREFPWTATADHAWEVRIDQGDGDAYDRRFTGTWEACEQPPADEVPVPAQPTLQDDCGVAYGEPVLPSAEGVTWSVDERDVRDGVGTVVVVATLEPGSVWADGGTEPREYPFPVTSEPCVVDDIPAPTFQEVCGVDGETPYVLPADGEHHRYVVTDPGTYVGGARVVEIVAELEEGHVAGEGVETRWTYAFREEVCDTPVVGTATAEVVVQPATCAAPGTAAAGETERASWTVVDVPANGGTATLVAVAEEGSQFEAGLPGVSDDRTTRTFTIDVPAAGGEPCSIAPPAVQPPTDATPPTTPQASSPTLPRTGFDVAPILLLGTLLAAAGTALVVRRTRARG